LLAVYSSCQTWHHDKADREEKKKSEGEGKKEAKKRIGREKVLLTGVIQTPP
jgi:hypothetical protein